MNSTTDTQLDRVLGRHLRLHRWVFKTITTIVLVTFVTLNLQPLGVALAQTPDPTPAPNTPQSDEAKLAKTILNIERKLEKIEDKLARNEDTNSDLGELQILKAELNVLDQKALDGFAAVEQHLIDKNLPDVIKQRHTAAVAQYAQEMATLKANLADVEAATTAEDKKTKAKKAKDHLKTKKHKRSQQPFDPDQPSSFLMKKKDGNVPKTTKEQFIQSGLFSNPYPKYAANDTFRFDELPGAGDPAYVGETAEIVLTQAIHDKANELNHDPVAIYRWVLNNIEWIPTWGAFQSADLTLGSERGNAMDISSLLIALLRASGIPARYVHGTIEVPKDPFINWVGDFANAEAAIEMAATGGIPTISVVSGGQIVKVRVEHIWVEAAIDFVPSRGAKNLSADTWVSLDPSYKQYEYLQGLDALTISGIDVEQLAQDFLNSGTVNEQESWVTGFDPAILEAAHQQAQTAIENYIDNNLPSPTVGDVIGGRRTIIQQFPVLPTGLANTVIVNGARYAQLPTALQHRMSFAFAKDIFGELINPITYPWATLNNQKITLSFRPAAQADEDVLLALLPEGEITDISQLPSSIPAYLINVIPQLALNEQVIKQGNPMQLGDELSMMYQTRHPHEVQAPYEYKVIAGSYLNIPVVGGSSGSPIQLSTLQSRLQSTKAILESGDEIQIQTLNRETTLGDLFYTGGVGYFAQYSNLTAVTALSQRATQYLAIGYGSYGYEPNLDVFFGIPRAITLGGAAFNIRVGDYLNTRDNDSVQRVDLKHQTGIISSVLEHAILEQMLSDPQDPMNSISAVKALQIAASQGQRIYLLTDANRSTTFPALNLDPDTELEISAALSVGQLVVTHTNPISVPGWTGAGYIILDANTGVGSYKISGGQNGGWGANAITVGLLGLVVFQVPGIGLLVFFLIALVIFILNLVVMLDSIECGGEIGIGIALALSLVSVLPVGAQGAVALRAALSSWISTNGYVAGVSAVCSLDVP